jgi:hypothetical protein
MSEFKLPTEIVSLPSKGLLYPKESPLSKGEIEMKYMSAKEEDILTNANYIRQGIVIDKLLETLIVTKINFDDLLLADKDAIIIAARILGYGKDYPVAYNNDKFVVDLSELKEKEIDETLYNSSNEFTFDLPHSKNTITFKLLTHGDEKKIDAEIKGLKKLFPQGSFDVTTRLKYMITSINGKRDTAEVRKFIDGGYFTARDARAFREQYSKLQPGIEMKFYPEGVEEGIQFNIGLDFFWPDAGV